MSREPEPTEEHPVTNPTSKALTAALDVGLAELDAGKGIETSPDELLSQIDAELGMRRDEAPRPTRRTP